MTKVVTHRIHPSAKPIKGVDPFVGIGSVALTTCQSPRTLRRNWLKGLFPTPMNLGGKLVWRQSTIESWMKEFESSNSG